MENLSQFADFTYPVFYRERANLIFAYLEGYKQTGDSRWLTHLRTLVGNTADLSNKQGWLTSPTTYAPPVGGLMGDERISGFQFAQTVWAMGRYLDFSAEYGLTDDLGVAAALSAYGDFMINHLIQEIPDAPGSYATIDSIWFDAPFETYLEVNNWCLLMADTLAYAHKYSGRDQFLTVAGQLYQTGSAHPVWLHSPPVYIASKDLVNALNWGLVYMNQTKGSTSGWVPISGSVSLDGTALCAMVLANGQYMFTCNANQGRYDLTVPLDDQDTITLHAFCSGMAPFKQVLTASQAAAYDIAMFRADAGSRTLNLNHTVGTAATSGRIGLSGVAEYNGTPLNMMVLANGQYMFTPADTGAFSLEVPVDSNGEITLYGFCAGFQPYKQVLQP